MLQVFHESTTKWSERFLVDENLILARLRWEQACQLKAMFNIDKPLFIDGKYTIKKGFCFFK